MESLTSMVLIRVPVVLYLKIARPFAEMMNFPSNDINETVEFISACKGQKDLKDVNFHVVGAKNISRYLSAREKAVLSLPNN